MELSANEIRNLLYLIRTYSQFFPKYGYKDLEQKFINELKRLDRKRS